ncbi:YbgA family protein [Thermodesulforhabdus norvegica]|uniref:Uncharacterized conserved protein YbgA, DUF1722 family n=1 Tax=Thermodesulforhabdus norvegica TaxID=39841 RepID=A0A1I4UQV1_9BACT|nr:DUF523 and DUF1722 domain-containing protein [Thermodesulforhabdus norvegica]SFM91346.1 Uncharacterized conserved protein YbgA, DUF1722 family [Thermodesulforhabdus norvegica]
MEQIKIGVSACLLGREVRYNGGHAHDRYITDTLGKYFDFVPVCPETEAGFGVPREAMRLVGDPENPRLVTVNTGKDMTDRLLAWARRRVRELERENLCGFIFKANSPSSGMERVKVYSAKGMPVKKGVGLFARTFMLHFPRIPVEEDGRLHDPELRENFIERVFTLARWRKVLEDNPTPHRLVQFHTEHKLLIMAHSEKICLDMGKLVARVHDLNLSSALEQYEDLLMRALKLKATVRKHTNVLQHMMGYFKKVLTGDEKRELLEVIEDYRKGYVPLIVPVTLMKHYVRKYNEPYLARQVYLNPHPLELKLRNHA